MALESYYSFCGAKRKFRARLGQVNGETHWTFQPLASGVLVHADNLCIQKASREDCCEFETIKLETNVCVAEGWHLSQSRQPVGERKSVLGTCDVWMTRPGGRA